MDEIRSLIRSVVPANAEIDTLPLSRFDGLVYRVCWSLDDDPTRPHKKSKTIAVHVPYEMVQDLPNYPAAKRCQIFSRLKQFLEAKYSAFDPSHTAEKNMPPPVEDWVVPPDVWSI